MVANSNCPSRARGGRGSSFSREGGRIFKLNPLHESLSPHVRRVTIIICGNSANQDPNISTVLKGLTFPFGGPRHLTRIARFRVHGWHRPIVQRTAYRVCTIFVHHELSHQFSSFCCIYDTEKRLFSISFPNFPLQCDHHYVLCSAHKWIVRPRIMLEMRSV